MKGHLDFKGRSNVVFWTTPDKHSKVGHLACRYVKLVKSVDTVKYRWKDAKVVGTTSVLNAEAVMEATGIMIGDPLEWSFVSMGPEKRIYNSFDDYTTTLFKCLFTRI